MLRFNNMDHLRKLISPDVEIEADEKPRPAIKDTARAAPSPSLSVLEQRFAAVWQEMDGAPYVTQHRFHPTRRWLFDFAWPAKKIAVEVQGGLYAEKSGHRSFEGVQRDYEKTNAAMFLGWKVFQVTSTMMKDAAYMEALALFVENAPSC